MGCMWMMGTWVKASSITLVENGKPQAVVVVANHASELSRLAVEELVEHVERSTGVRLEVVAETVAVPTGWSRLFIGPTQKAEQVGIDVDTLPLDAFVMRSEGRDLFILGKENGGGYDSGSGYNGTLYGVYELLERSIGVLWLWPGELGTYIPKQETVRIDSVDEIVEPALSFRGYRTSHLARQLQNYQSHVKRLAFSPAGLKHYNQELQQFMRRHRLGRSERKPVVGHFFGGWWQRYGEEHPDWFAMNEQGERVGPNMNVANPELHRFLVEEVWDGKSNLSLGEADVRFYCRSPESMAWDEPQPADWNHYITSNRYARFAREIRDLARKRSPEADFLVTMFVYMDYTHAPTIDIDLTGVYGEFCPWFSGFTPWYPMSENLHKRFKKTWLGWSETGMTMGYRPNYLLFGYVMPHLSTWQSGDMYRFAAEHGMIGHDFDSLWGHWAVKGPMLYMHMRLPVDPTREIGEVRSEYFSAFGPGAGKVEEYFDYWEDHSTRSGFSTSEPWRIGQLYPLESLAKGKALLEEAMLRAQQAEDPLYAERVAFLQAGLEHARLTVEFVNSLDSRGRIPESRKRFDAAREALHRLIEFRRDHEHLLISDYIAAASIENRRFDIDTLLEKEFTGNEEQDLTPVVEALVPWNTWFFRKDPNDAGVRQQWFRADLTSGNKGILAYDEGGRAFNIDRQHWTPLAVPARLAETSIGDYHGYGWYVTTFMGPDSWEGHNVTLHFEAVDEQAWVYVNGQPVGEHTVEATGLPVGELWNRPFTLEVPAGLILTGEENLLVVRIHSSAGATGIWGEVGGYVAE